MFTVNSRQVVHVALTREIVEPIVEGAIDSARVPLTPCEKVKLIFKTAGDLISRAATLDGLEEAARAPGSLAFSAERALSADLGNHHLGGQSILPVVVALRTGDHELAKVLLKGIFESAPVRAA